MTKNLETLNFLYQSNSVSERFTMELKGMKTMVMRRTGNFSLDKVISEEDTLVGMVTLKMDPWYT